uniref:Uncharacterized protein n=1 Tax=Salix viminalis TaxID=40686 RepID=A0A6N2KW99_SALVM
MGGDKLGGLERKERRRELCSDSHISAVHQTRSSEDFWKPPQTRRSRRTVPPPSTVSILLKKIAKSAFFFQSEPPAIFASYHRWMKLKFGYVVQLSVINVRNGGDEELTVQQGDMMLNSSSPVVRLGLDHRQDKHNPLVEQSNDIVARKREMEYLYFYNRIALCICRNSYMPGRHSHERARESNTKEPTFAKNHVDCILI